MRVSAALMLAVVAFAVAANAIGAWSAEAPTTSPQQQRAVALARTALGGDGAAAMQAVRDLEAMGEGARPRLANVVHERLARDRDAIQAAIRRIGDTARAKAAEEEMAALRKSARANIEILAKDDTMRIAHENYDKLAGLMSLYKELCAAREAICPVMARRGELLAVWREVGQARDNRLSPDVEEKLKTSAEDALGMTVQAMQAVPEYGEGQEPADLVAWNLWFFRACRRIEAYNQQLASLAGPAELENIRFVNAYRESLGTLPMEIDARLMQSARRHSKEMVDLGYFEHDSPTPSQKTPFQRMKNAGYRGGYAENIAEGVASGKAAFWMWFESPPHHKNMVHAKNTAIGVGRWGDKWTQNFGTAGRLMLVPEAERAKVAVLGDLVPPQGGR